MGRFRTLFVSLSAVTFLAAAADAAGSGVSGGSDMIEAELPAVGCSTSGMSEDQPPPTLMPTIKLYVPAGEADHLAYYRAAWPKGVVGPRDWTCAARSGSDGITLTIGPKGTDFNTANPVSGPRIELRRIEGGTSGRFAAAAIMARAFPSFAGFAKRVKAEHQDQGRIVFQAFASDELKRESDRLVVFRTPSGRKGLGTINDLAPGPLPIGGFASVSGPASAPEVTMMTVRLPPDGEGLSSFIVAEGMEDTVSITSRQP